MCLCFIHLNLNARYTARVSTYRDNPEGNGEIPRAKEHITGQTYQITTLYSSKSKVTLIQANSATYPLSGQNAPHNATALAITSASPHIFGYNIT